MSEKEKSGACIECGKYFGEGHKCQPVPSPFARVKKRKEQKDSSSLAEAFSRRFDLKKTPCFEWTGSFMNSGYGRVWVKRGIYTAHRASYLLHRGAIPAGMDVCHTCDNRKCVNPYHLFIGTRSQNMMDARDKKRIAFYLYPEKMPRGERHGRSKLKERDVLEIRESKESADILAKKFGVDKSTIIRVRSGKTWRKEAAPHGT